MAILIFGIMGDNEEFMPDAEHNYLSWSFGLAFVGTFFMFVTGALFMVEVRNTISQICFFKNNI